MKKKILSWLLLFTLLVTALPVLGAELSVTTKETLLKGVTYQNIRCLLDNGWQDIHVITADLKEPHLKFDVLSHTGGKSLLENTYTSAVNHDAVAAINADFFQSIGGGKGSAIGLEIKDGVLKTSPAAYEKMNVLYETKGDSRLFFDMFSYNFSIIAPSGANAPISVINKYDDLRGIVLYTPDWGDKTPGSAGNVFEIVVSDGVVTARNQDVGPVDIPKDGYVLACDLGLNTFIYDNLQVGDAVTLSILTTPNKDAIETAVGGGGMILVNGKIPSSYSHTISGTHPRSAVGIDETGTVITLAAVDGRRSGATGMTMTQLGYLMADLGCYNAMNLDGGGSTLMAVKKDGAHQVVNTPSDGSKRPVTNSIGIMAEASGERLPSAARLTYDKALFKGTSGRLELTLLDQYGMPLRNADPAEITWTVLSGNATVSNNIVTSTIPGIVTLRGEAAGFLDEATISILDTPQRLSFSSKEYALSGGESCTFEVFGRDLFGTKARLAPGDIKIQLENPSVASVSGNQLTAKSYGSTVLSASFGGATAYAVVTVDGAEKISAPKDEILPDPMQKDASIDVPGGFTFTVFGNTRTPVKFFDLYIMNGVVNTLRSKSSINYFVGNNIDTSLLTELYNNKYLADSYAKRTYNGSTFITLKNSSGSTLFGSDKSQWEKLRQEIEAFSGGNLFVFLNDHNISSMDTEILVFKKLMAEAAKKASNVYVFAGGWVNETVIEDGVRYITTAGVFPSIGVKPPATNISYLKYYLVTVNGDIVTYETKGIVE